MKFLMVLSALLMTSHLSADDKGQDASPAICTIVTFGDSTTAPRGKLKVYSDLLTERLAANNVTILNRGVGGNTTAAAKNRFASAVLAEHPQIVVIQFGINDSAVDVWQTPPRTSPRIAIDEYEKNLRGFIHDIRESGGEVILMTPNQLRWTPTLLKMYGKPPVFDPEDKMGFTKYLSVYAERVRQIAKEENVELVDVYALYDDVERSGASAEDLLSDGMHPNAEGHKLVADALEPVIRKVKIAPAASSAPKEKDIPQS